MVYDGVADTVTVYDAARSNLPSGLREILARLGALWTAVMFPVD
jgi:hypothetical protein